MNSLRALIEGYAQPGRIEAIWLRPARLVPPVAVQSAEVSHEGLAGDHARPGKRAITLIQAEHLAVIGAMLGQGAVDPAELRRNLVVSGLNLNGLRGRQVQVGTAIFEITGICAPCSRMEAALGQGGYGAMRGHGGWCASILQPGRFQIGDRVHPQGAE